MTLSHNPSLINYYRLHKVLPAGHNNLISKVNTITTFKKESLECKYMEIPCTMPETNIIVNKRLQYIDEIEMVDILLWMKSLTQLGT